MVPKASHFKWKIKKGYDCSHKHGSSHHNKDTEGMTKETQNGFLDEFCYQMNYEVQIFTKWEQKVHWAEY